VLDNHLPHFSFYPSGNVTLGCWIAGETINITYPNEEFDYVTHQGIIEYWGTTIIARVTDPLAKPTLEPCGTGDLVICHVSTPTTSPPVATTINPWGSYGGGNYLFVTRGVIFYEDINVIGRNRPASICGVKCNERQ